MSANGKYSVAVGKLPLPTQLFINNEFVDAEAGCPFDTLDPATEQIIATIHEAGREDVDKAVTAARNAFESFQHSDGGFRRDLLLKLADQMEQHLEQLAEVESLNNGKPLSVAKAVDIPMCIRVYRYYAGWADKIQGKQIPLVAGSSNFLCYTRHEPVGVVGQIIPWNFPLLMMAWKIAPAIAMGCTVVLKSSEKTPVTALMMGHLIKAAGFPPGVINILSGWGHTTGRYLTEHRGVDKIAFTGSTQTGQRILTTAAEHGMKRVSLELGGKSPLIVFADADIDQAIDVAELGLFFNQGQCCIASSRVFVEASIYDKFLQRATERALKRKEKTMDPRNPECMQGPQVDRIQFDRVLHFIESGKHEGAKLLCGGHRSGNKGFFIEPTIFADVKDEMKIAREEIFGPVMSVMKFDSLDEVVARANKSQYGLGAGVCTRDIGKAIAVSNRLKAGTVYVNCYDVFDPAAPFGGFKKSGLNRELGEYGLEPYTEIKTVIVDLAFKETPAAKANFAFQNRTASIHDDHKHHAEDSAPQSPLA